MGYHPRIETSDIACFLTTRSTGSRLWFVNNPQLEDDILGYVAKYSKIYNVKVYALAIEGNHVQAPMLFEDCNRASFMRDLNASIARCVKKRTNHGVGQFWGRRYSNEFLPDSEDIKDRFFYTVLQPVQDGLVEKISEYPGYNCFHDAIWGVKRRYKVVRWGEYNAAKRHNPNVRVADFTEDVELEYARLPQYEDMSQREYAKMMMAELEKRRVKIVAERRKNGLGFAGRAALIRTVPGAAPRETKTSTRDSERPRILSNCPKRIAEWMEWYFKIYFTYKECSRRYRAGELDVKFPPGTYPPHLPCKRYTVEP